MRWKAKPYVDPSKPHKWFAWHPVLTVSNEWVWLEEVYRIDVSIIHDSIFVYATKEMHESLNDYSLLKI